MIGCAPKSTSLPTLKWQGQTMGTYYRITLVGEADWHGMEAELAVESRLKAINTVMSTYQHDSELAMFNRLKVGQCLQVSTELLHLVALSESVHDLSQGAFNPLVGPLVNRWGFGPDAQRDSLTVEQAGERSWKLPEADEIAGLLKQVDLGQLSSDVKKLQLCKQANIYLDLSAIAKGYAVDEIAVLLEKIGAENFLVDIGGELKVQGHNPTNSAWRLAVEKPDSRLNSVEQIVELNAGSGALAIATSGDYRNYFEYNGQRYSHTVDPRSGYPISHALASVTVIHSSAAIADAWATALNVLGWQQAKIVAEEQGLAVFLLQREDKVINSADTDLNRWHSVAFEQYMTNSID